MFLRLQSTDGLISELLDQSTDSYTAPIRAVRGGKAPGTYVVKELVYAYAMWVSAKFHLAVIRAYDESVQKANPVVAGGQN